MRRPGAFHAAVSVFTIVPVPPIDIDRDSARRAALALPWVGLLIGVAAAVVAGAIQWLGGGSLLAGVLALALLAAVTGAMHLDGLADTADGIGSRRPAAEALAIMKRSDIGPMGVAALVLVLLVDAAALSSPHLTGPRLLAALACLPMVGRVAVLTGTGGWAPSARPGGFGALFSGVTSGRSWALSTLGVLVVSVLAGSWASGSRGAVAFGLAATLSWLVAWLAQRRLIRRFGGLTGDLMGALVEVSQLVFVVAVGLVA
ncbi:MAG: adenosylcobinamide-GDP ribazoletransferase [Actinobacteria bacterium]|nr:adenosylcobinamide-GDP ribazoletransferase [Actinomycetota bacterium]